MVDKCENFKQPECGNYILTMLITNLQDDDNVTSRPEYLPLVNKTVLFICSTFSFSPQCQLCDANNISHCVNTSSDIKDGYSPYDRRFNNVYTLTKENHFYTGSTFNDKNGLQAIAKFPNPFMGTKFTLHTQISPTWRWLFNPVFISLYEVDQYVYFFWREEAFEADRRMYTRVGRVCKSDRGLGSDSATQATAVFSTFVKARILCSVPKNSKNRHPFEYNELVATHLTTEGSSPILYGIFSTPSNGPNSSAVCTFRFDDTDNSLSRVFKGDYLFSDSGNQDWSTISNPTPFDCPGEGANQRDTDDAQNYLLMEDPVTQSSIQPIHIEDGTRITAMTVDLVPQANTSSVEVLYIGLSNGVVKAVIDVTNTLLYTIPSGEPVDKLVLHEKDGIKYCYVTSANNVAVIQLGKCHEHKTCSECGDDIYCNWDGQSCTNEISNSHVTCPPTPSTTTTSSAAPSIITHYKTVFVHSTPPVVQETLNDCSDEKTDNDNNLPIVVGVAFGGIALGFVIAVIVFLTAYFVKKSHSPKESAVNSTTPSKEDIEGDPFDSPVTMTTKPEQNHYMNGFNHYPAPPTHMTRGRTESTKRLMSVTSDYPDSPSPPGTLPLPSHRHE
ncbi:semaphorin-5B-like isoform X2 [Dysidea avara]